MAPIEDRLGRPLRDLRISVTDRCNFRCSYCMPKEHFGSAFPFLPRADILSFEEIARLARVFHALGLRKIRLTGGEPLLRADLPRLVQMLSDLPETEVALTTNGSLLVHQAEALAAAGLDRVSVSLDSLDDDTFRHMNDVEMPVSRVLQGIEAAARAGLEPIKVNAVVKRGVNDRDLVDFVRYFKGSGHIVRFIEFMDVGTTNDWKLDEVVPAEEILQTIARAEPLEPLESSYRGEVARRWRLSDGSEIGIIASVTQPFCGDCTRARLSADGKIFTCLFAADGYDLRGSLRSGLSDEELLQEITGLWRDRRDRYSELRTQQTGLQQRPEMSYLGG